MVSGRVVHLCLGLVIIIYVVHELGTPSIAQWQEMNTAHLIFPGHVANVEKTDRIQNMKRKQYQFQGLN